MHRSLTPAALSAMRRALALALALGLMPRGARAQSGPLTNAALSIDSLLATPGTMWVWARSEHFVLHFDPQALPPLLAPAFLDSLEKAWSHATPLIGAAG